jgi:putative DNA-invertase from lambdoid prophage Rac
MENGKCAILRRVSTISQGGEAQNTLTDWADARGLETWQVFSVHDSAYVARNGKGKEFDAARAEILEGARLGKFRILVIYALDRLSRRGIRDTLTVLEKLHDYGIEVWSMKEPWLEVQGDMWEMQVAMFAWQAKQESQRKSERMTDSIAGRKAQGRRVGRAPGSKDKKPRKRAGYLAAWEEGGARREAGGMERPRDEHGRFQEAG